MPTVLSPQMEAFLQEKAEREGHDVGAVANLLILNALEAEAREPSEVVENVRMGLEDFAAGRYSTAVEAVAEIRARHGIPS